MITIFLTVICSMAYVGAAVGFYCVLDKVSENEDNIKMYSKLQRVYGKTILAICWPACAAFIWAYGYMKF